MNQLIINGFYSVYQFNARIVISIIFIRTWYPINANPVQPHTSEDSVGESSNDEYL